ncbi:type II toxin-antitoxin system VapC family toxin [bacterium]|nr:type II toxin-antitoxin system VapC family toxin [bacterium]
MARVVVIDACVALKWEFRDEDHAETALELLSGAMEGWIELFAPTLWLYEVVNVLRSAAASSRMTPGDALRDLHHLLASGVRLVPQHPDRFASILSDAIACRCSAYDFSYIDLAREFGCDFYTGDRKLYNLTYRIYPFVRWIGDFEAA